MVFLSLLLLAGLLMQPLVALPDGTPDPSFGTNGVLRGQAGLATSPFCQATALGIQTDGKIVVAGSANDSESNNQFALVRYTAAGALDTTFGSTGTGAVLNQVGQSFPASSQINALAIQPDTFIVVGGMATDSNGNSQFVLARYSPTGQLDTTFGTAGTGIVYNQLGQSANPSCVINALALQANGDIVVAGSATDSNGNSQFALARYTSSGQLDTGFGISGSVLTPVAIISQIFALGIQTNGDIVAAGFAVPNGGTDQFALARYTTNGALDTTFGTNGIVLTQVGESSYQSCQAYALGIQQSTGAIILGGYATDPNGNNGFALARYTSAGAPDTTFGTTGNGTVITQFGSPNPSSQINALAVDQTIGSITVGGYATNSNGYTEFATARYLTTGSLDGTFGTNGSILSQVGQTFPTHSATAQYSAISALGIQPDGAIVVTGYASNTQPQNQFATVRYTSTGQPDSSFGTDSLVLTQINPVVQFSDLLCLAIQVDGSIVLGGGASDGQGQSQFALIRVTPTGTFDPTFSGTGLVLSQRGQSATPFCQINALALQIDGSIVVAGYASDSNSNSQFELQRYSSAGLIDTTFGVNGTVLNQVGQSTTPFCQIQALALQPDGNILVAGSASDTNGNSQFVLARYTTTGQLDTTFGSAGTGIVYNQIGLSTTPSCGLYALALQGDGSIVVAGYASTSTDTSQYALARYTAAGVPDPSFGPAGTGSVLTQAGLGSTPSSGLYALVIQPDSSIVGVGYASDADNTSTSTTVRYTPAGALDATFGTRGIVRTQLGIAPTPSSALLSLALQADGKILVSGYGTDSNRTTRFALARYTVTGSLDTTFGTAGIVLMQVGQSTVKASLVYALGVQADGDIVVGGAGTDLNGYYQLVIARYLIAHTPLAPTFITSPNYLDSLTPTIAGTAQNLSAVSVLIDNTFNGGIFTQTAANPGPFALTVTPPLTKGAHTVQAVSHYFAGKVNLASVPVKLITDNLAVTLTAAATCTDTPVTLTATISGGVPPFNITFSDGFTVSNTSNTVITHAVTPTPVGSFTVSVTDATTTQVTSAAVSVTPRPALSLSATPATITRGQSALLTGTVTKLTKAPYTFRFANGTTVDTTNIFATVITSATIGSTVVMPTVSSTYCANVTDANGCVSDPASPVMVTVTPTPPPPPPPPPPPVQPLKVILSSSRTTICPGQSVLLTASVSGGVPPFSVTFCDSLSTSAHTTPVTVTHTSSPLTSGSLSVTVQDSTGASRSASVPITVNATPTVTITATAQTVCAGQPFTLTAHACEAASFYWTGPHGQSSSAQTITVDNAQPADTGTYTVTATNPQGCSTKASIAIEVKALTYQSILSKAIQAKYCLS